MKRKTVTSGSPYEGSIGFSRAVRCGRHITVSGTAPILPGGSTAHPGDLYQQTRYCLTIIRKAIEEAGGTIGDTVRTRIMLTDMTGWREAARAHGEIFADIKPACTFVEVKGFVEPDWLVEIEADCIVED